MSVHLTLLSRCANRENKYELLAENIQFDVGFLEIGAQ
jgi:hypothetical protein